jgi:predicted permease
MFTHVPGALREAARPFRASPLVTILAVVSLALGIGANTALFSIVNSLILRPLPVEEPDRLVVLEGGSWTNPIWEQVRARQDQLFAGAFAWSLERFDLSQGGPTDLVQGAYASGRMFEVLGIEPHRGRLFDERDDVPGGGPHGGVAVISHTFWQSRFGGRPDAIGARLTVERVPFTVVGVLPPGFTGPEVGRAVQVIVPIGAETLVRGAESFLEARSTWWLDVMARLRPDQTIEQATAAMRGVQPAMRAATIPPRYPPAEVQRYLSEPFTLLPAANGLSDLRTRYETALLAIMAVVGLVLLIACANIANLMLVRATARRRELSIRLALGATRGRLALQLLGESFFIAGLGALAGLLLARWGSALLVGQLATWRDLVFLDLTLDWRVVAFTAAVTVLTALLSGLAPALSVNGLAPNDALKDAARGTGGDRRFGVRGALVVLQVALSLVLVVAAGLFLRTFAALSRVEPGMTLDPLLVVELNLQKSEVLPENRGALIETFRREAAEVAGVASSTGAVITPLAGPAWNTGIDDPDLPPRDRMSWVNAVSPDWFATVGTPLLAGRELRAADGPGALKVAIVNETFVRQFFRDTSGLPVGRTFRSQQTEYTIVGVAADSLYRSPRAGKVPIMFVPLAQQDRLSPRLSLIVRTNPGERASVGRAIATRLARADPRAAFTVRTFDELTRATVAQERLVAMLSGGFGGLALLLAGIGLYGVMAYSVSRRRGEIAIRMALGAAPSVIVRGVARQGGVLLVIGLAAGALLSIWGARYVQSLLFNLEPRDAGTMAAAMAILLIVGLAAAALPAWRASRIDPAASLREG